MVWLGWIVTLRERLCKFFLQEGGNRYLAVNKENGSIIVTILLTDFMYSFGVERMGGFIQIDRLIFSPNTTFLNRCDAYYLLSRLLFHGANNISQADFPIYSYAVICYSGYIFDAYDHYLCSYIRWQNRNLCFSDNGAQFISDGGKLIFRGVSESIHIFFLLILLPRPDHLK